MQEWIYQAIHSRVHATWLRVELMSEYYANSYSTFILNAQVKMIHKMCAWIQFELTLNADVHSCYIHSWKARCVWIITSQHHNIKCDLWGLEITDFDEHKSSSRNLLRRLQNWKSVWKIIIVNEMVINYAPICLHSIGVNIFA